MKRKRGQENSTQANGVKDRLLHRNLTYEINGAMMDVHNGLGPGWDEWDYHRAAIRALAEKGLKADSKMKG